MAVEIKHEDDTDYNGAAYSWFYVDLPSGAQLSFGRIAHPWHFSREQSDAAVAERKAVILTRLQELKGLL